MKAIVTGAAGFIGYHLSRRLLREGMDVIGIDSLTDYYDVELKKHRVRSLTGGSGGSGSHGSSGSGRAAFTFVEQCLTEELEHTVTEGTDYLFHLAGQPGVRSCWGDSFGEYTRCNITATQRLLETIKNRDIPLKRAVYASTSSIYGDGMEGAAAENHLPNPMSPYAVTKLAGEHLFRLYGGSFGIPSLTVRYFSVYGPGQRPDMAFDRLCRSLRFGEPFTLYGGGAQSRDFTYVEDIVEGTLLAARNGAPGEIYNLGSGRGVTMNQAVSVLERLAGTKLHAGHEPLQAGEMRHTLADISKARLALGYAPSTTLEEGLALQWEAFCRLHRYAG